MKLDLQLLEFARTLQSNTMDLENLIRQIFRDKNSMNFKY
ncbi:hypothetical protein J587_2620 [Acinetobacter baumannii 144107]|nr:hypothetical protein J587_2620 [Acinetobacter baumannii 144107]